MFRPIFEDLIAKAIEKGAIVDYKTTPYDPGWYGKAENQRITWVLAEATEDEAWAHLIEHMCLTTPGQLILKSCEFGNVYTANVIERNGRLGSHERRSRLEIRGIAGEYQAERAFVESKVDLLPVTLPERTRIQ